MFFMTASTKSKQECTSKTKCHADSANMPEPYIAHDSLSVTARELAKDIKFAFVDLAKKAWYCWSWTWKLSPAWNIVLVPLALFVAFTSFGHYPATGVAAIIAVTLSIVYSVSALLWFVWFHVHLFYRIWMFVTRREETAILGDKTP